MKVFRATEQHLVNHWVIALNAETARDLVIKEREEEIKEREEEVDLFLTTLNDKDNLTIDFEGKKITHTCEEWLYIYDFKPRYLACSEY